MYEKHNQKIGKLIERARQKVGLTQLELSNLTNISLPSIKKYEQGAYAPKIDTLRKITRALDLKIRELVPHEEFAEIAKMREIGKEEYEVFLKLVESGGNVKIGIGGSILSVIPAPYITSDLVIEALKRNGDALEDIPFELSKTGFVTYEMYKIAVNELGDALRLVPMEARTKELCEIAIFNDGRALRFAPEKYITEELIIQAIKTVPTVIDCVLEEKLTDNVLYEYARRMSALILSERIPNKIHSRLAELRVYR